MRYLLPLLLSSLPCFVLADDTVDAAIGGGIGGAVGAAVGQELGDREGAIVGGAVGAAVGAAIATKDDKAGDKSLPAPVRVEVDTHPHALHCPPGQAKKGRC